MGFRFLSLGFQALVTIQVRNREGDPETTSLHTGTAKSGLELGVEVVVRDPKELSQRQMGANPRF